MPEYEVLDPYEVLKQRVEEFIQYTRKKAALYQFIYRGLRLLIIVLSALTAGAAKFSNQVSGVPHDATPWLAISIAIFAGVESWMKPGNVYWEHYRFNDQYISAETKLSLISPSDKTALDKYSDYLDEIDRQYRLAVKD